jgi:hypothetical protein
MNKSVQQFTNEMIEETFNILDIESYESGLRCPICYVTN